MFGLDYTDIRKFHISLGVALIFGAALISITTVLVAYEKLENISDDISSDFEKVMVFSESNLSQVESLQNYLDSRQNIIEQQSKAIINTTKLVQLLAAVMGALGFIFFGMGYVPWFVENLPDQFRINKK